MCGANVDQTCSLNADSTVKLKPKNSAETSTLSCQCSVSLPAQRSAHIHLSISLFIKYLWRTLFARKMCQQQLLIAWPAKP